MSRDELLDIARQIGRLGGHLSQPSVLDDWGSARSTAAHLLHEAIERGAFSDVAWLQLRHVFDDAVRESGYGPAFDAAMAWFDSPAAAGLYRAAVGGYDDEPATRETTIMKCRGLARLIEEQAVGLVETPPDRSFDAECRKALKAFGRSPDEAGNLSDAKKFHLICCHWHQHGELSPAKVRDRFLEWFGSDCPYHLPGDKRGTNRVKNAFIQAKNWLEEKPKRRKR